MKSIKLATKDTGKVKLGNGIRKAAVKDTGKVRMGGGGILVKAYLTR